MSNEHCAVAFNSPNPKQGRRDKAEGNCGKGQVKYKLFGKWPRWNETLIYLM